MKTIKKIFKERIKEFTLIVTLALISGFISTRSTILIKEVLTENYYDPLKEYIVIVVLSLIFNLIYTAYSKYVRTMIYNTYTKKIFSKIMNLPAEFFTRKGTGEIISHMSYIDDIASLFLSSSKILVNGITVLFTLYIVFTIDKVAFSGILVVIALVFCILKLSIKKIKTIAKKIVPLQSERMTKIDDAVKGSNIVKSFNRINDTINEYNFINNKINKLVIKKANLNALLSFKLYLIFEILNLVIILFGIINLKENNDISNIYTILLYIGNIMGPLITLMDLLLEHISSALPSIKKIDQLFDEKDVVDDGIIELKKFNSKIELNNVSFKYVDSDLVLNNINMSIKKGQKIGIAGPSGSGKSTLINLFNRLYEVTSGSIKIDNIDIKDITLKSLRDKIGVISQDVHIFDTTVLDNIRYGKPSATESEVIAAAKKANCEEFIMNLPEGYNTNVGPNGSKLSGGQKQRISIARLFLSNPDILILDEATSALDNKSEEAIKNAIDNLSKDKTVISIAHRLSTIQDCDMIYVIANHEIVESGTHNELINNNYVYASLAKNKNE